jgi:integrase
MSEKEARRKAAILYGQCLQGINVFAGRTTSAKPALPACSRSSEATLGTSLPTPAPKPILLVDAIDAFRVMFSPDWRPTTPTNYERWLGNLSDLHDVPVAQIDSAMVINLLEPYWANGNLATGKFMVFLLKRVMAYAIGKGWYQRSNPCDWVLLKDVLRAPPKKTENRPAVAIEDLPRLYAKLAKSGNSEDRALAFLALVPARKREVSELPWREIDRETACWNLPEARSKTKSNWRIPLAPQVLAFLAAQPAEGQYVFPGKNGISQAAYLGRRWREHVPPPATIHGLRSNFSTWAHQQKNATGSARWSEKAVEGCLTHVTGSKVHRAYDRDDTFADRMDCLTAWAAFVTSKMDRTLSDEEANDIIFTEGT